MPILDNEEIYSLSKQTQLDITHLKTIFDMRDTHFTYSKNNQFSITKRQNDLYIEVDSEDPYFILDKTNASSKESLLIIDIHTQEKSLFQLYFKRKPKDGYIEENSFKLVLHKGENHFRIVLPSPYINNTLRVDFTRKTGAYRIKTFKIYEIVQKDIFKNKGIY